MTIQEKKKMRITFVFLLAFSLFFPAAARAQEGETILPAALGDGQMLVGLKNSAGEVFKIYLRGGTVSPLSAKRSDRVSPPVFPRPRDTSTCSSDAGRIRRIPRNSPPDIPLAQGPDPAAARIDRHETTPSPSVFHGYGELALHRQIGRELFRGRPFGERDPGFHPPAVAEAVTGSGH